MVDHFSSVFKRTAEQLALEGPDLWEGLRQTLIYLREFRRGAVAPDVRWGISQSVYGPNCGEVRWPDPEVQSQFAGDAWRGLFVAHPDDDWYVFTVLGNKAGRGNAWYDSAVPLSDELASRAIAQLGLKPFAENV